MRLVEADGRYSDTFQYQRFRLLSHISVANLKEPPVLVSPIGPVYILATGEAS